MADLTKWQHSLLVFMMEMLPIEDSVQYEGVTLTGDDWPDVFQFAYSPILVEDEELFAVFTLCNLSDKVFFSFTDGDPHEVAKILTTAEGHDYYESELNFGHTINMLPSKFLEENGRVGIVLIPVSTLNALAELPKEYEIDGRMVKFYLCVFINEQERKAKLERGYIGLLDYFEETDKDIISVRDGNQKR